MGTGAEEGDVVKVGFLYRTAIVGTVMYTPCAEGDCWIIHTENGTIFNIQKFETIEVTSRKVK